MEGFLNIRLRPWLRRLITRLIAIVPALIVVCVAGEKGVVSLLILSQVILSMQLGFAVFPLVLFTSDAGKMGRFVNNGCTKFIAWLMTAIIIILNIYLLYQSLVPFFKKG